MAIAPPSRLDSVIARELILGGQKSGKSRIAEGRALRWLGTPGREAVLIATAIPGDAEMTTRIARHRADRAERVPGLTTIEEPTALASAVAARELPAHLEVGGASSDCCHRAVRLRREHRGRRCGNGRPRSNGPFRAAAGADRVAVAVIDRDRLRAGRLCAARGYGSLLGLA